MTAGPTWTQGMVGRMISTFHPHHTILTILASYIATTVNQGNTGAPARTRNSSGSCTGSGSQTNWAFFRIVFTDHREVHSTSLLMMMNGEQRGTGAGTGRTRQETSTWGRLQIMGTKVRMIGWLRLLC